MEDCTAHEFAVERIRRVIKRSDDVDDLRNVALLLLHNLEMQKSVIDKMMADTGFTRP